jgi:hypothetical protein
MDPAEAQPGRPTELCVYTIRLKRADGTEQVLTKPCPFLSTCKDLGRGCAEFQEQFGTEEKP